MTKLSSRNRIFVLVAFSLLVFTQLPNPQELAAEPPITLALPASEEVDIDFLPRAAHLIPAEG